MQLWFFISKFFPLADEISKVDWGKAWKMIKRKFHPQSIFQTISFYATSYYVTYATLQ